MCYRPLIIFFLHTLMCAVSVLQTFALLHFFELKEPVQNWIISSLVVVLYLFLLYFDHSRKRVSSLYNDLEHVQEELYISNEQECNLREKIRKLKLKNAIAEKRAKNRLRK